MIKTTSKINQKAVALYLWAKQVLISLIEQCKQHWVSLLITVVCCVFLILSMEAKQTPIERESHSILMLWLGYIVLAALVVANSQYLQNFITRKTSSSNSSIAPSEQISSDLEATPPRRFQRLCMWAANHSVAISFTVAFSTIPIFKETHTIALVNNLTMALCYALVLFHVVLYFKKQLPNKVRSHSFESQKRYVAYAAAVAVSFFLSTTVDNSVKFGTQFQLTVLSWLMLFHLIYLWGMGQWQLIQQLKNERSNAELMHLKSQVNPHFLFNTLNNLYGLTLEKSDEAPALILKLSEMLRYTIYQSKQDLVLVSEEVRYLEDFIQLQQVRYHKKVNVTFEHSLTNQDAVISPLLLLILVENAYKHGVEKLTEYAFVDIKLEETDCQLAFEISNNFEGQGSQEEPGIGLQNLNRRLNLLYKDRHRLETSSDKGIYSVRLDITLQEAQQK